MRREEGGGEVVEVVEGGEEVRSKWVDQGMEQDRWKGGEERHTHL